MNWIAPTAKDPLSDTLEQRLWASADQFRANSGLKAQEYSGPILGIIFLRFAEGRFSIQRARLETAASSSRRGNRIDEPAAYKTLAGDLQQRRHPHPGPAGPAPPPRRNHRDRGPQLSHQGPDQPTLTAEPIQSRTAVGATLRWRFASARKNTVFKPAGLVGFHAVTDSVGKPPKSDSANCLVH